MTSRRIDAGPAVAAGLVTLLLVAVSGRYGYHRDELYFLAAGRHLSWGYPDQPPFVPVLARLMAEIARGSLPVFRLPSALAAGVIVLLTAQIARELGASKSARLLAAAAMATSSILFGAAHLLSTTTFGLLAWAAALWLVVRILRTRDYRLFVALGVIAGIGLLDNDLVLFLMAGVGVGVLIAGPREVFRSPWLWVGTVVALALWTPYLVWQGQNGWPQLDVARSIASGGSGSSEPRWALLPFQFLMGNLWLTPVWVVGLWRLLRSPAMRWARAVGWCWVVLAVAFTVLGGKPYYLSGLFPVLYAAGAQPVLDRVRRRRVLTGVLAVGGAVSTLIGMVITLPLVPASDLHRTPILDVNYDAGETVAWPAYVAEIAGVYHRTAEVSGDDVAVLASNYGEAGAVDRYGPSHGLPSAYSGHMGFWWWGPPPGTRSAAVVAVGYDRSYLLRFFDSVVPARRLDNHLDVDNDEQGAPVMVCRGMRSDWSTTWPQLKRVG